MSSSVLAMGLPIICAHYVLATQGRQPPRFRSGPHAGVESGRQLGDVGGDAPGLVAGEQLGRRAPS